MSGTWQPVPPTGCSVSEQTASGVIRSVPLLFFCFCFGIAIRIVNAWSTGARVRLHEAPRGDTFMHELLRWRCVGLRARITSPSVCVPSCSLWNYTLRGNIRSRWYYPPPMIRALGAHRLTAKIGHYGLFGIMEAVANSGRSGRFTLPVASAKSMIIYMLHRCPLLSQFMPTWCAAITPCSRHPGPHEGPLWRPALRGTARPPPEPVRST